MIPDAAKSHHTVWISGRDCPPRAERYAVDGDRLVAFGDGALAGVADGTRALAHVHAIAGGPTVAAFPVEVRAGSGADVSDQAFQELLDHVPLGRDIAEVRRSLDRHRGRRILLLQT